MWQSLELNLVLDGLYKKFLNSSTSVGVEGPVLQGYYYIRVPLPVSSSWLSRGSRGLWFRAIHYLRISLPVSSIITNRIVCFFSVWFLAHNSPAVFNRHGFVSRSIGATKMFIPIRNSQPTMYIIQNAWICVDTIEKLKPCIPIYLIRP